MQQQHQLLPERCARNDHPLQPPRDQVVVLLPAVELVPRYVRLRDAGEVRERDGFTGGVGRSSRRGDCPPDRSSCAGTARRGRLGEPQNQPDGRGAPRAQGSSPRCTVPGVALRPHNVTIFRKSQKLMKSGWARSFNRGCRARDRSAPPARAGRWRAQLRNGHPDKPGAGRGFGGRARLRSSCRPPRRARKGWGGPR